MSALLATLTGLFASPAVAVWTLVWAIVAQNVTDNLVSPLVMQSAVKIHPAMSLIGITVGASLGGAVGMALAVPLTAAVKGAFIYYFESKTGRQLVGFDGAFFKGTPFHHADGSPVPSYDALDDDSLATTSLIVANRDADDVQADEAPAPEPGFPTTSARAFTRGSSRLSRALEHSCGGAASRLPAAATLYTSEIV